MARRALVTVLVGGYEQLRDQPAADGSMERICLTDDPTLSSSFWQIRVLPRRLAADPIRSARHSKILLHQHLPEYDETLYVDNTVELRLPPEDLFEALLADEAAMALIRHSWHGPLRQEFAAVLHHKLDLPWRIEEQRYDYERTDPEALETPTLWTGILLRRHHDPALQSLMLSWWEHVLRYSRRDQLSLPVLLRSSEAAVTVHDLDNHHSRFHAWPRWTDPSSRRVVPQWDGPTYEIALLENEALALGDQISALTAEAVSLRHQLDVQLEATDEAGRARQVASAAAHRAQGDAVVVGAQVDELRRQLAGSRAQAQSVAATLADLRAELDQLQRSTSWKVTRPLRVAGGVLRPEVTPPAPTGD